MLQLTASSQSFSRSPVSLFLFPPSNSLPSRYNLRDLIQMAFCALKQLSRMSSLTEDGLQPDYKRSLTISVALRAPGGRGSSQVSKKSGREPAPAGLFTSRILAWSKQGWPEQTAQVCCESLTPVRDSHLKRHKTDP